MDSQILEEGDWVYLSWHDPTDFKNFGQIISLSGNKMRAKVRWQNESDFNENGNASFLRRVSPLLLLALQAID